MLNDVDNHGDLAKAFSFGNTDLRTDEMWTARDAAIELSRQSQGVLSPDEWIAVLERLAPAGTFHSAGDEMRADDVNALLEADAGLRNSTPRLPSALQTDRRTAGWWDGSMHAADWFAMAAVTPREAACLLCQIDPLGEDLDPENTANLETGPDDFRRTHRIFEDAQGIDSKGRTLIEWLNIAEARGCKAHSWLYEYIEARARLGFQVGPMNARDVRQIRKGDFAPQTAPSDVWLTKAQNRAREIVKEQKARDLYPSQESLGDTIAAEFRRDGIVGADGKPLTGSTIKRHALKGISSAAGKQLSTTNRQSK